MRCHSCGNEMVNTIGGCYECKHCGLGIHDGVYRLPDKMTEEPNTLIMRFHKKNIVKETENTVMIQVDDAMGFLEQVIKAFVSPNMAVIRMDEE